MKLCALRKAQGMTQAELAKICDTTQQQIAKIENGVSDPKLSTIRRLASALGVEVMDLFWSRREFVQVVNETVEEYELDLRRVPLMDVNSVCAMEKSLPAFHPLWEELAIDKKNRRVFAKPIHFQKEST